MVGRALDPGEPSDTSNTGVARFGGDYYQLGCVPILLQDIPIGILILGERLDQSFAGRLRRSFAADIVVATPTNVIASTVPEASAEGLMPISRGRLEGELGTVRLGKEEFMGAVLPLGQPPRDSVLLYLLHPLSVALAPLHRTILFNFIGWGFLAVLLAGLGAGAVSRSVLAPFQTFVNFMEGVAQTGDHTRSFDMTGTMAEIQTLNISYQHLIDSIAQKHAQVEQRTMELSETNATLRQEIHEREEAERALRSSEEQLRQSQKLEAIGTLAGGVAHDFNNLLTVVLSYLQLALTEMSPGDPVREDLEQARLAATRAAGLTRQLLAFSRKQVLQPRILDLAGIVRGIETMLRRVIGEDIDLQTLTEPGLPRIEADPGQLEQVVLNLAVNARDAMPQGGSLCITTASECVDEQQVASLRPMAPGRWVVLTVSDTGIGMDETTRARIFEPFFTTKEAGKGTGLGLSTVYGIVKQSGGFIWVDSAVGKGTRFRVYLPPVDAVEEAQASPLPSDGIRGGSETILLVEDEEPVRNLARRILEHAGYHVLEANGATEALALSESHQERIDLVLTDVVMPLMSGRALVERLSQIRPGTCTLYMSGHTDDAVVRHGLLDPSRQLLQKPFTPESLTRKVRDVLDASSGLANPKPST